jgi:hypothetical protein
MKIYVAYTIVAIGIPMFIGYLLGGICSMPISMIIGLSRGSKETPLERSEAIKESQGWIFRGNVKMDLRDRIAHTCLDIFNGFWAVFTAGFIFHLFGLAPGVCILLIVAAWEIFYTIAFGQSLRALFGAFVGAVIGWFLVLRLFFF